MQSYRTQEELLADPKIDAVCVLTPLNQHKQGALAALRAGKHVFVEKPVGETVNDILELKSAAVKAGRVCMPGHNYIYEPVCAY